MELCIDISPSEKRILETIGKERWQRLYALTVSRSEYRCSGCGFAPSEGQLLRMHVFPYDESTLDLTEDFSKLETAWACDACHTIKHFDVAAELETVRLVNSDFTQKDLILVCRHGNRALNAYVKGGADIERHIFPLKKKAKDYLAEISVDKKLINPKIKVIFTDKFNWGNCR